MKKYYKYSYLGALFGVLALIIMGYSLYSVPLTTDDLVWRSHFSYFAIMTLGSLIIGVILTLYAEKFVERSVVMLE